VSFGRWRRGPVDSDGILRVWRSWAAEHQLCASTCHLETRGHAEQTSWTLGSGKAWKLRCPARCGLIDGSTPTEPAVRFRGWRAATSIRRGLLRAAVWIKAVRAGRYDNGLFRSNMQRAFAISRSRSTLVLVLVGESGLGPRRSSIRRCPRVPTTLVCLDSRISIFDIRYLSSIAECYQE